MDYRVPHGDHFTAYVFALSRFCERPDIACWILALRDQSQSQAFRFFSEDPPLT